MGCAWEIESFGMDRWYSTATKKENKRFTSAYGPSQAAIQEPPTGLILTYHISPAYARPCLHWCIFERPGGNNNTHEMRASIIGKLPPGMHEAHHTAAIH